MNGGTQVTSSCLYGQLLTNGLLVRTHALACYISLGCRFYTVYRKKYFIIARGKILLNGQSCFYRNLKSSKLTYVIGCSVKFCKVILVQMKTPIRQAGTG